MLLDPPAQLCQSKDLTVREGGTVLVRGELDLFGAAARTSHDGDALVPQAALDYLPGSRVNDEVVRVDSSRDDGLAEARAGVYDGLMALPRDRVGGKQDAGDRGVDHPLHDDSEPHAARVDPVRGPVADGPIRPQRSPAALHRIEDRLDTDHVQIRVLLARKAGPWQVLRRSRRSYGYGNGRAVTQLPVSLPNGQPENIGDVCPREAVPRLSSELCQTLRVPSIRRGQRGERGL